MHCTKPKHVAGKAVMCYNTERRGNITKKQTLLTESAWLRAVYLYGSGLTRKDLTESTMATKLDQNRRYVNFSSVFLKRRPDVKEARLIKSTTQ